MLFLRRIRGESTVVPVFEADGLRANDASADEYGHHEEDKDGDDFYSTPMSAGGILRWHYAV